MGLFFTGPRPPTSPATSSREGVQVNPPSADSRTIVRQPGMVFPVL
jgi:hypothetical protein